MGAARENVWHVIKTYWPLLLGNALEWYESRLVRRKNCSQQVTCMGSIERNLINLGFSSLGISRHISIHWQQVLSSSTFVTLIRNTTIWKSAIIQASAMLFLWLVSHVPRISGVCFSSSNPDLPKDPSKIIQPLQEKSTLKKRLLFHAKKDCYFTQKKTLIFIKKRLLFFQAKHHHVYVCCMLKEKLDIM